MVLGLSLGLVLKPNGDGDGNPKGPQQLFSTGHAAGDSQEAVGWWSVRNGPVGDWVYGTDWVHPKDITLTEAATSEPAPMAEIASSPPAQQAVAYLPPQASLYSAASVSGDIRDVSVWRGETRAQDGGQRIQVGVFDDQRRGQVDDAAHRPDPGAQPGESGAERTPLDRRLELDNADGPHHADVGDAG